MSTKIFKDLTEETADQFYVCRLCKQIIHVSQNPHRDNFESVSGNGVHDSTLVVECRPCRDKINKAKDQERKKARLANIQQYLLNVGEQA